MYKPKHTFHCWFTHWDFARLAMRPCVVSFARDWAESHKSYPRKDAVILDERNTPPVVMRAYMGDNDSVVVGVEELESDFDRTKVTHELDFDSTLGEEFIRPVR